MPSGVARSWSNIIFADFRKIFHRKFHDRNQNSCLLWFALTGHRSFNIGVRFQTDRTADAILPQSRQPLVATISTLPPLISHHRRHAMPNWSLHNCPLRKRLGAEYKWFQRHWKAGGPERGHAGHHEVQMLENGNILFHDDWDTVKEMKLDGTVVWSYKSSNVHAFTRMPNGNTMIAESGTGRIIVVDSQGKLVSQTPLGEGGRGSTRQAEVLPNGNYLVCAEQPGTVTEYDTAGKIVWEYEIKTRVYGAIRLRNGNTLICSGSGNSVVEVSPEKKVVWQVKGQVPDTKITLKWTACLHELPDGQLLIGNCHAGAQQSSNLSAR